MEGYYLGQCPAARRRRLSQSLCKNCPQLVVLPSPDGRQWW